MKITARFLMGPLDGDTRELGDFDPDYNTAWPMGARSPLGGHIVGWYEWGGVRTPAGEYLMVWRAVK